MTKKILLLRLFFITTLIFITLFKFNQPTLAAKVFSDNFDDGNADGWVVTTNPCQYNDQPAKWEVVDGKLGIKINSGSCVTEIMPSDSLWDSIGNNYIVEFDMTLVSGTDHNFAFRYTNPNHWYDFHIQSPNWLILQGMLPQPQGNYISGNFSNGQTIHFKIIVEGEHLKIYTGKNSENLLVDNPNMGGYQPAGRIAFQASTGSDPVSETWFDNLVVTSLDSSDLNVPDLKQTDPLWGNQIYDSANLWATSSATISSWGCALTSAAMVFQFNGIKKLPDGTNLNPGTLNDWLKNQPDGYVRNGWVNWLALSRLSKLAKDNNPDFSFDALEYSRIKGEDKTQLKNDLENNIPDILEEPGHFIVAKGVNNDTFNINDPYFTERTDLTSYNNTFLNLGRYTPTNTDLSYIMLVTDQDINISLKNAEGETLGESFIQQPLTNEIDGSKNGNPIKIFYLKKPLDGDYKIEVSSNTKKFYQLDAYLYDQDGNYKLNNFQGIIAPNKTDIFNLSFNKQDANESKTNQVFSFQTLKSDINLFYSLKLIKNYGLYKSLIIETNLASKFSHKNKRASKQLLQSILKKVESQENKSTKNTFKILSNEIKYLINNL